MQVPPHAGNAEKQWQAPDMGGCLAEASCHVGGAVNAKMVSQSLVEDMMMPLDSLERSISDLINEQ